MVITVIAKIIGKQGLIGFKVIDRENTEVTEVYCEELKDKISTGLLDITNLEYLEGEFNITDESELGYPVVNESLKIIGKSPIIILDRISAVEYKCTNYSGLLINYTTEKVLECIKIDGLANCRVNGYEIEPIKGKFSYEADKELRKYNKEQLRKYKLKSKLLGINNIEVNIIGDRGVIIQADYELENVIIPKFVSIILDGAFKNCDKLRELELLNNIESIGNEAFEGCTGLINLSIPDSVRYVGDRAFRGCLELCKVDMRDNSMVFGREVFSECTKLQKVRLSSRLEVVTSGLFLRCKELTDITIPESVNVIKSQAFRGCLKLKSINIKHKLDSLGFGAFAHCGINRLEIPEVGIIENYAFSGCKSLSEVILGKTPTISISMFSGCIVLKKIALTEGLSTIDMSAFSECKQLRQIEIPRSIEFIDKTSFDYIENTIEVILHKESKGLIDEKTHRIRYID